MLVLASNDVNLAIAIHFDGVNANDNGGGEGNEEGLDPLDERASPSVSYEPQDPAGDAATSLHSAGEEQPSLPATSGSIATKLSKEAGSPVLGPADAGPTTASPAHRQPTTMVSGGGRYDDEEGCVLVQYEDAIPEQSPAARSRRRPGTAPSSRNDGQDMRGARILTC